MTSETGATYISLTDAKDQLSIDDSRTDLDSRIQTLIGAAIDWAENYTNRSLGELLELNSPSDSSAVPLPNPVDSPSLAFLGGIPPGSFFPDGYDWQVLPGEWAPQQWHAYWQSNPIQQDQSKPLRRDVKAAILMYIESLYDRNPDNFEMLQTAAMNMLWPYRIALGV